MKETTIPLPPDPCRVSPASRLVAHQCLVERVAGGFLVTVGDPYTGARTVYADTDALVEAFGRWARHA